ncbi:permease-like cell division protein FtsX [Natranaerobius trueperi]|uniref:Cell division protein FtsX n=1 Tax=Natranaerobius trueperi TaxID=759412 RepID=A0A226BXF8_9FIRM|nr:permease-like cell division protein FtsX [Natranaerobius trueperi]OWZ83718.1 ABC transporter permease [Natranaerobius trueperi]
MKFRSWIYFIGEAFKSVFRNGWMSFASVGVVTVTLLILGVFMIINYNVEHITEEMRSQVEIAVWLEGDLEDNEVDDIRRELIKTDGVEKVKFVSKDEGLDRMKEQMGEQVVQGYYEDPEKNPLPNMFEVSTLEPEAVPQVAEKIQQYSEVEMVDYGEEVVETLFQVTDVVQYIAFILMIALALTATFLIANTIKLTVYARSEEIKIMRLVGATNWFIRWPFLLEGLLLGFLGSAIPVLLLRYGYVNLMQWLYDNTAFFTTGFLDLQQPEAIFENMDITLIALGTTLGAIGSISSLRKFLKV